MCSFFGLSVAASLAILVAGAIALGLSLPSIWKAGVKFFKHKLNLDEKTA